MRGICSVCGGSGWVVGFDDDCDDTLTGADVVCPYCDGRGDDFFDDDTDDTDE